MKRRLSIVSARTLFLVLLGSSTPAPAAVLTEGFQEEVVFAGLTLPTAVAFAPDGRVFIAEKRGAIKVFSDLADTTPDTLTNLNATVHHFSDRGLLSLVVDPDFPTEPYVYVLYTYNYDSLDPGAGAPRWPDTCPDPPGATSDGCVVNGRLARLEVAPDNTLVGPEQVLIENRWCQQYPSHSVGNLEFDGDGALYVSAGEGASFTFVDYGQGGGGVGSPIPPNPCGDPPSGRGGLQSLPDAEGGALRSQDLRTPGDPVDYGGAILRIDPDTGAALPTNPLIGGDPEDDRVVAYGLRNPFRMTVRPGTNEVWIGDVGWTGWEEINRISDPADAVVENFGWPCYEGPNKQSGYNAADLDVCETLYADTGDPATAPYYAYQRLEYIDPDPLPFRCDAAGGNTIAGLAFYSGTTYPSQFEGALFLADYSRRCLWVMFAGAGGLPDVSSRTAFAADVSAPVDLQLGQDGKIYYVDVNGGRILRFNYTEINDPPQAKAEASPAAGPLPLSVQFDAALSSDPDPFDTLTYEWDLDGDGNYDDSTSVDPSYDYTTQGQYTVGVRVTDTSSATDTDSVVITAGNSPPTATILQPASTLLWTVGQQISFQGQALDPEDGPLPASAMHWDILTHHCPGGPGDCHTHPWADFDGIDQGSFIAPDHEWYSFLEIVLTATDFGFAGMSGGEVGSQDSVSIDPDTVELTFETNPPGLDVVVGAENETTPFTRTVIIGSTSTVSAPSPQNFQAGRYTWQSWSDAGVQSHQVIASTISETFTADYGYDGIAVDWFVAEFGSAVAYLANSTDPGIGMSWTGLGFDDTSWSQGAYGVGYELDSGAESLILSPVPNTARSVYSRSTFNIDDANNVTCVFLGADYDDGYVAWINGTEVYRSPEMPVGPLAWDTTAAQHESSNGAVPDYGPLQDISTAGIAQLQTGGNVLAVGVWNAPVELNDLVLVPQLLINGPDIDQDNACDVNDNCLDTPNFDQADTDSDGAGDACDPCSSDPDKIDPGACGCGVPDTDTDSDSVPDCLDQCPSDSLKTAPGVCGCGVPDTDTDADATPDCLDGCPIDPTKTVPGVCGCGVPDNDLDSDGFENCIDNCPAVPNPSQEDSDSDGIGDDCGDLDGDGVTDGVDCAPTHPGVAAPPGEPALRLWKGSGTILGWTRGVQGHTTNVYRGFVDAGEAWTLNAICFDPENPGTQSVDATADPAEGAYYYYLLSSKNLCGESTLGLDGQGNPRASPPTLCPTLGIDSDSDGNPDLQDNCPLVPNPGLSDVDKGFIGDACDNCPTILNADQADANDDGRGDACDHLIDADSDGIEDGVDNCPSVFNTPQLDADTDGLGDACDSCPNDSEDDVDSDGFCADVDNCPTVPNGGQVDSDSDGFGDLCDGCPADPGKISPGVCGCGVPDTDTDSDGTPDCNDNCPDDPLKTDPGQCGCSTPDTDTDSDGTVDCNDGCPNDPLKIAAGICGCGVADTDTDSDGTADCNDNCPNDPLKVDPGQCGCGTPDTDADSDGTANCNDNCPSTSNMSQADGDSDGFGDACDPCLGDPFNDQDFDGFCSSVDNCPAANAPQTDTDSDGIGDFCEMALVNFQYFVSATEVTNAAYAELLNAVAAADPNGLFNTDMETDARGGIQRLGSAGSFTYAPKAPMADKPVNFVSWLDAARYTNWLHNRKPPGAQGPLTTETGAYDLTVSNPGETAVRSPGAIWFLLTKAQWDTAAYDDTLLSTIWLYPTRSDSAPAVATATVDGDVSNPGVNVVNYAAGAIWNGETGNITSVAGAGPLSASRWGTYDQGGNVAEWTETLSGTDRRIRGGSYSDSELELRSLADGSLPHNTEDDFLGFRVGSLPICQDADSDGFGVIGHPVCGSGPLPDCNDAEATQFPGNPEICDGLDNDCDMVLPPNEADADSNGTPDCAE